MHLKTLVWTEKFINKRSETNIFYPFISSYHLNLGLHILSKSLERLAILYRLLDR